METWIFQVLAGLCRENKITRVLSLGYPDLLVSQDTLKKEGIDPEKLKKSPEHERIAAWHGWKDVLYETDSAFRQLGFETVYIDLSPSRDIERIVDLNNPLPDELLENFDLVLDCGTLEHCFNLGQAFQNCFKAAKPGGYILHGNPLNWVNHGFWNLSPGAYADFYRTNGADIQKYFLLTGPIDKREVFVLSDYYSPFFPSVKTFNVVVVKKGLSAEPVWPMQHKYVVNRDLKG